MGLAMSELGRLDISKILENIGGLLVSLQSSNILQEDVLSTVTNLLEEIQFDQIDTEVLSDLINDLEPLYKDSDWSSLIYILKDLDLPMFKGKNIESSKYDIAAYSYAYSY
nr:uncharacterized protein LOC122273272 [Parasteatoda tepidariorum]